MKKFLGALVAVLVALGVSSAITSPAQAAPAGPAVATSVPTPPAIAWGTCASVGLQRRGAQCGMLTVPLDYSKPNGTKIQLAISRILHKVPDAQYQGVMITNPGGPGGSGLTLSVLGEFVPNGAGNFYDWIGFDPRGVGSSVPAVSCDPNYAAFNRPTYIPILPSALKAWQDKAAGYAQACGKNNGDILKHVTTVDSVKDMESIRLALGQKQINYYGFSYGTYLGQVYSTLYPANMRRMVLDSNVDPRKVWYQANLDQDVAFDKNMKIWFGWLASYDSVYHLGKTEAKVEATFYGTEAKLSFNPAAGKIGGDEWVDIFLYAGYYQQTWLELADVFANYIATGDPAPLIDEYLGASGLGDDNGYAMYLAVQCTDVQWPTAWSTWSRDNWRTFAQAPYETWANAWYNAPCINWPAKAQTPVEVDGSKVAPALLIDETLDAATPYPGSLEVRKRFPSASLIALPGGTSHANSLNGDACLDDQIAAYLADGTLPARKAGNGADATCEPLPLPAPETAAAASAASAKTAGSQSSVGAAVKALGRVS